jgi:hypothetical protein
VFSYLDEPLNFAFVYPRLRLDPSDGAVRGKGAKFRAFVGLVPGNFIASFDAEAEMVEHYYPERIELAVAGELTIGWTLGRVGSQTLVELRVTFSLPGGPIGRLAGNGLAVLVRRDVDEALDRLAEAV